ncbi:MAG: ClpX C4-type zinc finger protein [Phycisphaerales bacterium]
MQREGINPEDARMEDILCDFCRKPWTMQRPMVEGHRGSCVCGDCLTIAYMEVVIHKASDPPKEGENCIMCLEVRDEAHWRSPAFEEALICKRCIKQAAGVLHKDRDIGWTKPVGGDDG